MTVAKKAVPKELLDSLLADYQKPEDLIGENGLLKQLTKLLVEKALDAELTEHLGHGRHEAVANASGNTRNGKSKKTLKGEFGEVIVFPELGDTTKGGDPKNWLAVRAASESDRPFVLNVPSMPEAYIDGLSPSDATRVIHRGARYGWRAILGAGFLWPQNACLFVES